LLISTDFQRLPAGTAFAREVFAMRKLEYVFSVLVALFVLGGLMIWTQASQASGRTAVSCRSGKALAPVVLRGMSVYRCPAGKTS